MDVWETRYGKMLDFYDDQGNKIVPAPGTVLWVERKVLMEAVEAGGDYDSLWAAYSAHFQKAVGRRINLKKKR